MTSTLAAVACVGLLLPGCGSPHRGSDPDRPSVLLITLDTTRADHLGTYGGRIAETPAYDLLSAEGVTFLRAYSTCPLTIPSHATILTGLVPPRHGVRDNGDFNLGDDHVTLAECFRAAGWTTAAFTAAFPTQRRWGFGQGFEIFHDPLERPPDQLDWRDERRAGEVVDDAIAVLSDLDGPLFVWVHLFDAHAPYDPPEPFRSTYPGSPYDGEIAYAAHEVGRLLDVWDAIRPVSLVVLTADHGEGLGDGGEETHGFLLHDGTIRVPLILRSRGLPGFPAGARVEDPVGHPDIAPTILAAAGLPVHSGMDGRDLRLGGSDVIYSESLTGSSNLGLAPLYAWTGPEGRYTEGGWGGFYPAHGDAISTVEDGQVPGTGYAERLAALKAGYEDVVAPEAALSPGDAARLEALGYLGGAFTSEVGTQDPRDVIDIVPLTWRARQALAMGRLDVARRLHTALATRMPGAWGVVYLEARLLFAEGHLTEAADLLLDLHRRSPSSSLALEAASVAWAMGDWAGARDWYAEALAHQPMSADAMAGLVHADFALGNLGEARAAAEAFLDTYPDHADLALVHSVFLRMDGRPDLAVEEARYALDRMPGSLQAWNATAQALWEAGRADEAVDLLQEIVRINPWDVGSRLVLAGCMLEVGRRAEAVRTLKPAAALLPDQPEVLEALALAEAALAAERERRPSEPFFFGGPTDPAVAALGHPDEAASDPGDTGDPPPP
ncbi:MAG: sulfatase-like hydrolase/transferase [Deltaproteobacteria bacterium]|nr:sulfatase-like hydrolase/transferase [Deltaproteobacteria bacterium]